MPHWVLAEEAHRSRWVSAGPVRSAATQSLRLNPARSVCSALDLSVSPASCAAKCGGNSEPLQPTQHLPHEALLETAGLRAFCGRPGRSGGIFRVDPDILLREVRGDKFQASLPSSQSHRYATFGL